MYRSVIKKIAILVIFFCAMFSSCKTTKGAVAPSQGALEYRGIQGEVQKQQADLAITGQKIEEGTRGIVEGLAELETAITEDPENVEVIIPKIQSIRVEAKTVQVEVESLNVQLAQERETIRIQNDKFNKYEFEQNNLLSKMDDEITDLRIENKTIKGQRNTLLAIVITAISVIVIILVVKVLRALRIIPI